MEMDSQNTKPIVAILLSTYNGEKYVKEQIQSLMSQTYPELKIFIRDDGSTDSTDLIISEIQKTDSRVNFEKGKNLGCVRSFLNLLENTHALADILMFCDQDDVWLPSKVSTAVSALCEAGLDRPLLFHTDLIVVDRNKNLISSSFMKHQGLSFPGAHLFETMLLQNCVVGCTVAMTASFVKRIELTPESCDAMAMHDWWLALIACSSGSLIYSSSAEIMYRQHDSNVSGAGKRSLVQRIRSQFSSEGLRRIDSYIKKISIQSFGFLAQQGHHLNDGQKRKVLLVSKFSGTGGFFYILTGQILGLRLQNSYMNLSFLYSSGIFMLLGLLRFFGLNASGRHNK